MSIQTMSRRCPECGATALAAAGRPWLTCPACPIAWNPFLEPTLCVPTFRPADQVADDGPRLPFFVAAGRGGERSRWVAAFFWHAGDAKNDPAARLASKNIAELVPAPLGVALARGPAEALPWLRQGREPAPGDGEPRLLSLAVLIDDAGRVFEPISGWSTAENTIRPRLL